MIGSNHQNNGSGGDGSPVYLTPAVSAERMLQNMRSAMARGLPEVIPCKAHKLTMSIAGGGPSLADTVGELQGWVCCVNGSLKWVLEHGPRGELSYACGIMDAGPHIADMIVADKRVRYYVASVCDPLVFDKLKGCDVRLWHVSPESTEDPRGVEALLYELRPKKWHAVAGGCTMGLRWLNLGYMLGFRRFALHGLDSSFRKGATHAYPDRADDKEHFEFDGYQTRANFMAQLHDFGDMLEWLADFDASVKLEVYGDGLLQNEWKAFRASNPEAFAARIEFPAHCQHTQAIMLSSQHLAARILRFTARRGVCVQAGGNVGVLANYLAKKFEHVYTIEPDPDNFDCMGANIDQRNVTMVNAALGDEGGTVGIMRDPGNSGASHVVFGLDIPQITIDSLKLKSCDLIVLDVEGYELKALKGAIETIKAHKPVIVLEDKGHGARYGAAEGACAVWLAKLGYVVTETDGPDVFLEVPNGG